MSDDRPSLALERLAAGVLGLYLAGGGFLALARGQRLYANYLRLPVPALLAIPVGVALIIVAGVGFGSRAPRPPRHL